MKRILSLPVFALAALGQGQPPTTAAPNNAGQPGRGGPGRGMGAAPGVVSPEVLADRRVVFRLRAPKAADVSVTGEVLAAQTSGKMTRDDSGVWSVTIGPLSPDIYGYSFNIDGVTVASFALCSVHGRSHGPRCSGDGLEPGHRARHRD